jgi:hypothetical protein
MFAAGRETGMAEHPIDERIRDMRREARRLLDEADRLANSAVKAELLERALRLASAASTLEARALGITRR